MYYFMTSEVIGLENIYFPDNYLKTNDKKFH